MLLPASGMPEADVPHPHITVMRPEAPLRMRKVGVRCMMPGGHDAGTPTHAHGVINWALGAWPPQEAASLNNKTMTTTTI